MLVYIVIRQGGARACNVSHTYFTVEKCLTLVFFRTPFGKYRLKRVGPLAQGETGTTKKWNQRALQRGKGSWRSKQDGLKPRGGEHVARGSLLE